MQSTSTSPILRSFVHTFRWNTIESVAFHLLLATHQIALFSVVPYQIYGLVGVIFAGIFLGAHVLALGSEEAVSPFFGLWTAHRALAKKLVAISLLPTAVLGLALIVAAPFFGPDLYALSPLLWGIVALATASEALKRPLKAHLQTLLYTRLIAVIEIVAMLMYLAIIWTLYVLGHTPEPLIIFGALAISSLATTVTYMVFLTRWYKSIAPGTHVHVPWWRIIKQRILAMGTYTSSMCFSGHFLIPLFALRFGLVYAAALKFTSSLVYTITTVLQKIFSGTSRTLFAHVKDADTERKQELFSLITTLLYQAIYALIIFYSINHAFFAAQNEHTLGYVLVAFFFIIGLIDTCALIHERLYEAHEKIGTVCFANMASSLCALLVIFSAPSTPALLLLLLSLIRISGFAFLVTYSLRLWNVRPPFIAQPLVVALSVIGSIAFSLFINK